MNYQEALAYIYSFTDFERGGSYTRDRTENLPRITRLLAQLGNPQQHYTSTLVAGTKGKGSTAALIESVLRHANVHTGLYTQPDLHTFRERMRINGNLISGEEVGELVPEIVAAMEKIQAQHDLGPFITYEIGTALAFLYFYRQHVQHAIVEVGIGGRLDATNVLQPLVSVITSISFDHMAILGNTLGQIATEKAGIIKPNGIVVTSAQPPEALLAIADIASQRNARMIRVGSEEEDIAQTDVDAGQLPIISYHYALESHSVDLPVEQRFTIRTPQQTYTDLVIPLAGLHQIENATVALATLDLLREQGIEWNEQALRAGFRAVHWPARIEVVGSEPTIVVDGAHNADSMQKLLQTLHTSFTMHRLIVVLNVNRDKDIVGIVQALTEVDIVILTHMQSSPRALASETLQELFTTYAPSVQIFSTENIVQAMELALDIADLTDLICITGSLYLAGEALRWAAAHGDSTAASEIEGVDH